MSILKILFCGDIVGSSGMECIKTHLPTIQEKYQIDFTIVNGENANNGFGITPTLANELFSHNIDCITLGNHSFDHKAIIEYMEENKNILHPCNYTQSYPNPWGVFNVKDYKILVINLLGKLFMNSKTPFDNPFDSMNKLLNVYKLKHNVDMIFVDFHAETTSEKNAMGHFLDGKISALIGTHSHIPTSDYSILNNGTAYQSDVGMCGDYNSVIGMTKESSLSIFLNTPKIKLTPASNGGTLCATYIEIDTHSGLSKNISHIQIGGKLNQSY